jgi:hypothetical protein
MRKNLLESVLLIVALFSFNLCCEKQTTKSGESTDWDAIKAIIYENPDIFLVDVFDTHKDTTLNPVLFRVITSQSFDLDTARRYPGGPTDPFDYYIHGAWGDSIKGVLHYFVDGKEHTKSIYAHSVMNAYFEQWLDFFSTHRGWILKRISGNVIASVPTYIIIPSVHITSEGVDTTFNENMVLNLVKKDSVLHFAPGKKVTFTVDADDISDLFLFLHIGEDGNFKKIPFIENGDDTFSASWTTTSDLNIAKGYKHAFVDAVSRDAVNDTTAKYDSKAWGIIYRIK